MAEERPAAAAPAPTGTAQIAKAALRRLALSRLEPTPENYARAWAEEGGTVPPMPLPERLRPTIERLVARVAEDGGVASELVRRVMKGEWDELRRHVERNPERDGGAGAGLLWSGLIERVARGLERGGRNWTSARKKDSLQRVLDSSRSDAQRLQHRLKQLLGSWESDSADVPADDRATDMAPLSDFASLADEPAAAPPQRDAAHMPRLAEADDAGESPQAERWQAIVRDLLGGMRAALPQEEARARELADELGQLAERIARDGATAPLLRAVQAACERARRLFSHRHHLVEQLSGLCLELGEGLGELAEDGSWAQGQMAALKARLLGDESGAGTGVSARGVRAASELLAQTRREQSSLRVERDLARDALKELIASLLQQVGELGDQTGRFSNNLGGYADTIAKADSIESLAGVVRQMVDESRSVQAMVGQTSQRLGDERQRALALEDRVRDLESELRKLSEEVSTDALTQVANRRGLLRAFEQERSRCERDGSELSVGLIDIDNFKKLNDTLGHAAGDQALKALATRVSESLRPVDHVARFGGEEFVVLLPATAVGDAQQVLTRLQRQLSASLFMHEQREVFVTFSAGVTAYRLGETLEAALERADEALYEAKRSGKNRTCLG